MTAGSDGTEGTAVRRATLADLPDIRRSLGRAFEDDPIWRFAIRRHDDFARRSGELLGIASQVHLEDDDSVWISDGGEAVAVWAPPKKWSIPGRRLVPFARQAIRAAGVRSAPGLAVLGQMERRHPRTPEHWYLAILGTDPDAQGRGLGSAVLAPVLERCDREVVHAFLESSKESNLAFYERHGFRLHETIELGRGCPPIFTMWRAPDPSR